jgi:YegS/Rv2252/BmrU family lipid kinase
VRARLIVNPASGGGRAARDLDALLGAFRAALGDVDCAATGARGDGARLAREAVAAGRELIVAVGGDGTASEVVDGLVSAGPGGARFAYVPRGTGGDLARTFGWPADAAAAARAIAGGEDRACDVGRIEYVDHAGARRSRHFANVAGLGIAGRVVEEIERRGKALGGRLGYQLAAARSLLGWRDAPVRWRADGGPWRDDRVTALSACNGRWFGGGMLVAPGARVDDGYLDVVIWRGLRLVDLALRRRMLRDGTHVTLSRTEVLRARVVEAEPLEGARVLLDVDGEQPGVLPARFAIVPAALRVRVPAQGG